MAQDLAEGAQEPVEASDEAAVVAGWAAVELVWAANASALIVAIELPTRQVPHVMRFSALNAVHQ